VETDPAKRKALPITSGVLDYFPDALLAVAQCSQVGNDQHNPGEPLHWAKEKSTDEADALVRHLMERGTMDTDGVRHSAKVAWRALAMLQREIDAERAADSEPTKWEEYVPAEYTTCGVKNCTRHMLTHPRAGDPTGHASVGPR